MNCPHCKKEISLSPKLWAIWYKEDLRQRVIAQTGNPSIADLVAPKQMDGPASYAIKGIEDYAAGICLAWQRGTLKHRDKPV